VSVVVSLNVVNAQTVAFLQRYNLPWFLNQKKPLNLGNLKKGGNSGKTDKTLNTKGLTTHSQSPTKMT